MPKLYYGICGEGLGHVGRYLAMYDLLSQRFEVHVFTFGESLALLRKENMPNVHEIPGIHFGYTRERTKVSLIKSSVNVMKYLLVYKKAFTQVAAMTKPDIVVSDFEPLMARIARHHHVPCVSLDNQHRFCYADFRSLPVYLKLFVKTASLYIHSLVPKPTHTIVSSFHTRYEKRGDNLTFVGPLTNKKGDPSEEDFVLVYHKGKITHRILELLSETAPLLGLRIKAYGNLKTSIPFVEHYPLSNEFGKDLLRCKAVFGLAGNQIISESTFYGKKIFVVPIPNHQEQYINAFMVNALNIGRAETYKKLTRASIEQFLKGNFSKIPQHDNTEIVLKTIERTLERGLAP